MTRLLYRQRYVTRPEVFVVRITEHRFTGKVASIEASPATGAEPTFRRISGLVLALLGACFTAAQAADLLAGA
jgi:hypothetical protein